MFNKNKIEAIPFRDFLAGSVPKEIPHTNNIYSVFPIMTPQMFFPIHQTDFALFVITGGVILIAAFSERISERYGFTLAADIISGAVKVVLPVVSFGALAWVFFYVL